MPTLNELKERAEQLCPYPLGPWRDAKFDRRAQSPDSSFADCRVHEATVSVMVYPPEGVPHIALLEAGETVPLADQGAGQVEQLELL